jgi:hypothetical protein
MRVQVRKCRFTGKLFEEEDASKYALHLRKLREKMRNERNWRNLRKTYAVWLAEEKLRITHIDMILPWFLENQQTIMDATNAIEFQDEYHRRDRFVSGDKFTSLSFTHSKFSPMTSNSHTCPDLGVQNWCAKDNTKPTGYPGWHGYIKGSLIRPKNQNGYPYGAALNMVGIKTESGGGGNADLGYGFNIFLDDWPGLKEQIRGMEEVLIINKLKGMK